MTHTVRHPRIEGYVLEVDDLSAAKAAGWVPTEAQPEPEPEPEPEPAEPVGVTVTDAPASEPRPKRPRKK